MPSLMINDSCDQPWLWYTNTSVRDCCMSILLSVPSSPKAKHLSPVSPAVDGFGPLDLAVQKAVGHLNPARLTTTGRAAKAALCRCTGRLFLHLQLP